MGADDNALDVCEFRPGFDRRNKGFDASPTKVAVAGDNNGIRSGL